MPSPTTVLVTGGNRGIGLAIVERFAREGHKVILGSRNREAGEAESSRLARLGHEVSTVKIDVADRADIKRATDEISARGTDIDVLINNAGVLYTKSLLGLSEQEIDDSFSANILGPIHLVRALAPGMGDRGFGRIVNVSSDWGSFAAGLGGPGAYGITKAAMNAMTLRLAKDLPTSIKVNAMNPGWVRSRMGGADATRSPEQAADTAFWLGTLPDEGPTGGFFFDRKPIDW